MYPASSAFCLIVALAATGEIASAADASPAPYAVEAKLVSLPITEAKDLPDNGYCSADALNGITTRPNVNVLSFPSATAGTAKSISLSLTQPEKYNDGKTRQIGPSITVSTLPDPQHFKVDYREITFVGYADPQAKQPQFKSHGISRMLPSSTAAASQYSLIDATSRFYAAKRYDADGRVMGSIAEANERQLLFVKITRG